MPCKWDHIQQQREAPPIGTAPKACLSWWNEGVTIGSASLKNGNLFDANHFGLSWHSE